uniref:Uncharacterized protein n=1 Tax=Kalanchoe fedtschenkoi TaxID=63787 RepID=A0A7N0R8N1_KALFE
MEWKEKRGLVTAMSPAKRGAMSSLSRKGKGLSEREVWSMVRSGSVRPGVEALEPLREGPEPGGAEMEGPKRSGSGLGRLMMGPLRRAPRVVAGRGSDLRLLLGVMGAPLAPVHVGLEDSVAHLSIKDGPMERLSAQYILHQYTAASGGQKLLNSVGNAYAMGKMKMLASTFETTTGVKKSTNSSRDAQSGGFVLWQMNPGKWYVELAVGNGKVRAGCDGKLVWRHTPWLGAHPAKGPVRPLRRALQV